MELVTELKNVLEKMAEKSSGILKGNKTWTQEIKRILGELGTNKGYMIATSGFRDEFESEWLYDLVWYYENENKMLVSVPLVMESEWQSKLDAVKFDFEKLLLANAELRLMICQCKEWQTEEYLDYFRKAIINYKLGNPSDTFLIALLDTDSEMFNFYMLQRDQILI